MNQNGEVIKIEGNQATISIKRKSSCGDSCVGCTVACKVPTVEVKADAIDGLKVGDTVEVFSEDINVLKYSLILYGVPLVLMITVIAIVNSLIKGENGQLYAALSGIASLAVSFIILKYYDKKESSRVEFKYTILKIIE